MGVLSEESGTRDTRAATWWWSSTRSTARPTPPRGSRGSPPACVPSTRTGPGPRWWSTRRPGSASRRCGAAGPARTGCTIRPSGCERLDEAIVAFSGYPSRHFGWLPVPVPGGGRARPVRGGRRVCSTGTAWSADPSSGVGTTSGGMLVCTEAGAVLGDAARARPGHALPHRAPGPVRGGHAGPAGGVPRRPGRSSVWTVGRLAQLVRAAGLQPAGHRFEPDSAHAVAGGERGGGRIPAAQSPCRETFWRPSSPSNRPAVGQTQDGPDRWSGCGLQAPGRCSRRS